MMNLNILKLNDKIIFLIVISIIILSACFVYTFSLAKSEDSVELPIVMYHSILKSKSGKYIIHPDTFEDDLKYIQSKGYTSITMTDLINYVYNDSPLPDKPIIITFDDGNYNNLSYAVPLLHKYNMKAVISIVGAYTDTYTDTGESNPNYGYLRWEDINNLISNF